MSENRFYNIRKKLAAAIFPDLTQIESDLDFHRKGRDKLVEHIIDIQDTFEEVDKVYETSKDPKVRREARKKLLDIIYKYRFISSCKIATGAITATKIRIAPGAIITDKLSNLKIN